MMFVTDTSVLKEKIRVWSGGTTRKSGMRGDNGYGTNVTVRASSDGLMSECGIYNTLRWYLELGRVLYLFSRA
jgi:hypothetical protein